MGLLRIMMPPKFQLMAVLAFGVAMLFIENQIQDLEDSRAKLGLHGGRSYAVRSYSFSGLEHHIQTFPIV
ncbi:putative heparan sulfate 2-O-sulfotransferase 1 [Triplophysa rosa]|uniref:Heparan sulfate 2-O-sulfotransferase 1 n=1 Tax=Triplophysa rosa TaxID=992332 RepID=A0A9W8C4Q1_TRIRA|nr:putative heparan sulfate 2-O-sulfotransferase 1 [Triplophysa rosa]